MKDIIKKLVVGIMAAALTTSYFTGCADKTPSNVSTPDITISDGLNPGITDSGVDTFSIKFKYWYDNQDIMDEQAAKLDHNGQETSNTFLDLVELPIYQDTEGNEYIISGRTKVYLFEGKITANTLFHNLRTEEVGKRLYAGLLADAKDQLSQFTERLSSSGATQPQTYEERVNTAQTTTTTVSTCDVFINNLNTGITLSSPNEMVDISTLLTNYTLGALTYENKVPTLRLYTAAGEVAITITTEGGDYKLTYSTNDGATEAASKDLVVTDTNVLMTLDAIENFLGYDVEYYNDFINIVTDNKDLITKESILPETATDAISPIVGLDDSKPANDPDNQKAINEYLEALRKLEEEQKAIDEITATPEQQEKHEQEVKDRQDMADNTAAYTTVGIPRTTDGDLAAPAKPTKDYKLPANAQLVFSGNASTAEITELPEGCYWTPGAWGSENAFTDPAGNVWLNNEPPKTTGAWGPNNGYYDARGRYHGSQEEINHHEEYTARAQAIADNGPTGDGTSGMTDEERAALDALLGI